MKTLTLISMFVLTFAFAKCQQFVGESEKESQAIKECNAIYPYEGDVRQVILQSIVTGEKLKLDNNTRCNLYCYLQKVKFFDAEGNMQTVGIVKRNLKILSNLAGYSDVIAVQTYQIARSLKHIQDKCFKAEISYRRLAEIIFVVGLAEEMNKDLNIKESLNNAVFNGGELSFEVKDKIKSYFKLLDIFLKPENLNADFVEIPQEAPKNTQGAPQVPLI